MFFQSQAIGVRQYPDSLSAMGRARIGSGYNRPDCIHPERGKVGEDDIESASNESWAVFNECVAGSYFANNPGKFFPES